MDFLDAVKIAEANQHLIGKEWKDATIDDIIIVPTNHNQWADFERLYIQTLNAQKAIVPFINSDVDIFVVFNKGHIRTQNLFRFTSIYKVLSETQRH